MQTYLYKVVSLLIFLLLLTSCEKDELTLPAEVNFEFEFIAHEDGIIGNGPKKLSSNLQQPPGKIEIDQGTLVIESIVFDGRRQEGEDVFFTSDLSEPVVVNLQTEESNKPLKFDIPQGIYNRIEIDIELDGNNKLPLVLEGNFKKGPLEEFPVRFEYDISEKIRVRAKPAGNIDNIVLKKDTPSIAKVRVDANSIFQLVNMSMINDANITDIDGEEVLLINNESNGNMYSIISARIDKSFDVIFD